MTEIETAALPKSLPSDAPTLRKPMEDWRDEKKTPAWLFAATVAHYLWPIGRELTEAEYDEAVDRTANIPIGYHLPK